MNKGKKQGKAIMAFGVLLILFSLLLTLYNNYEEKRAALSSDEVLMQLDMAQVTESTEGIPDYVINPGMSMRKKVIDGKDYVGIISVPELKITLPVLAEWSYDNFKISPCVYEGTPYLKNLIVCAHNYRNHFGSLKNLTQGSKVSFRDFDGNIFNYEVIFTEILDNNAVEEMSQGEWDLTLFTCTYGGATRVTVRCVEI